MTLPADSSMPAGPLSAPANGPSVMPDIEPGGAPAARSRDLPIDTVRALVAAREAAGMTSADIASQLKMAPRQIAALESGDWAVLPGLSFVRGALRSYGRAVGADVSPLLASLDERARTSELRASTSLQAPLPTRSMLGFGAGGSGSKTAWLLLGSLLLVALALFFGRDTDFARIPSLLGSTPERPGAAPGGPTAVPGISGLRQVVERTPAPQRFRRRRPRQPRPRLQRLPQPPPRPPC
ncbi:MAG: helix-turn-helix transcriptional regulator [Burkholderiales bacterium]|nr:helix-turn-helix transcriptional regulator [Burkholderiales bacterium]